MLTGMACQRVDGVEVRLPSIAALNVRGLYLSGLSGRFSGLISRICMSWNIRNLVIAVLLSPTAVEGAWLNSPNRLLTPT